MTFNLKGGVKPKIEEINNQEGIIHGNVIPTSKPFHFDNTFMFLGDEDGEYEYSKEDKPNIVKWGQLKLFVEELIIFTYYGVGIKDLVYVGAMEGNHTVLLSEMFPSLHFHLYDRETKERHFDVRLKKRENVTIHNHYFTDDDIKKYKGKDVMFFSDIRNIEYSNDLEGKGESVLKKTEQIAWDDMLLQQEWVEKLKPKVASLKFRLPYAYKWVLKEGKTRDYLDGVVLRQSFSSPTSSEMRLIVRGINYRKWDLEAYEKKCYYHNVIIRTHEFYNIFDDSTNAYSKELGLDLKYDCTQFMFALSNYLKAVGLEPSQESCVKLAKKVMLDINGKTIPQMRGIELDVD